MIILKTHIGEFVYVRAGRDKGKCLIVLSCDNTFLYVCDGKRRKVEIPKKKSIKHLSFTGEYDSFILDKLTSNDKPTNKEVKYSLTKYLGNKKICEI